MHKSERREKALILRKKGFPYSYISKKTGISKSTLSDWLTEVSYTPNKETIASLGKARAAATERKAQIRQEELVGIRAESKKKIGKVNERDLFMFGLGLYLGEGAKTNDIVRMVNSNPDIIHASVQWFLSLGVTSSQFGPRLHLYPDSNQGESLRFWSELIGVPVSQFQGTYIDKRLNKSKNKKGKLPNGTLHLTIRSGGRKEYGVLFSRMIESWSEEVVRQTKRG